VERLCADCSETASELPRNGLSIETYLTVFDLSIEALFTNRPVACAQGETRIGGWVSASMLHHRALGRDLDTLVVAVDNRRAMLLVVRAMLAAIGVGRIDTYDRPADTMDGMATSMPDLVIAADAMQPLTGAALIRTMRRPRSGPLALVPAMIMSAHPQPGLVAEALRAGAHQVLILPISASTLARRLDWLLNDDRPFELKGDHYVVSGVEERLALSFPRSTDLSAESLPIPDSEPEDEEPLTLYLTKRARAARN
jgi:DNA-binding NarL/FixJ family response regulator